VTTDIPELQPVVLTNMGAFFPTVVNMALDRLTILIQQIKARIGRSLSAPVSDPVGISLVLPSSTARANTLLAFDASGVPYAYPTTYPIPAPFAAYTSSQVVVATEGQTAFTLSTAYMPGNGSLAVYRNGQRMEKTTDYAETDSTHVTFASALNAGDRILFVLGIEVTAGAQGPMGSGSGTVTSVAVSVPAELAVSGSPVTSTGTIAIAYAVGYSIPSTANQTNWSTAYGWGNHASVGYITESSTSTLTNKTLTAPVITGYTETRYTANTSTELTIALTNGTIQDLTLTGNCMFTFPSPAAGQSFVLLLRQDATGSRTVTWPAAVKWPGSIAPTITATASKLDKFVFVSDGTYWFGSNAGQLYL
jgi:hypothetical protein